MNPHIPEDDVRAFADFIGPIMALDPEWRPTAAELPKHPWLNNTTLDASSTVGYACLVTEDSNHMDQNKNIFYYKQPPSLEELYYVLLNFVRSGNCRDLAFSCRVMGRVEEDYSEHHRVESVFGIHDCRPLRFEAIYRLPAHLHPFASRHIHAYCPP